MLMARPIGPRLIGPRETTLAQEGIAMSEKSKTLIITAIVAILPTLVGNWLTYSSSKDERVKSYEATQRSVEDLQKVVLELTNKVNYLEGRMDGARARPLRLDNSVGMTKPPPDPFVMMSPILVTPATPDAGARNLPHVDGDGVSDMALAPPAPAEKKMRLRPLPKNFDDALQMPAY
jgi:hypothetical protein